MRFSARGVAAMTEANGRPRVPHVLRKELAIPGRRASPPFGNKRRGWRLRQRAFTGDALEI